MSRSNTGLPSRREFLAGSAAALAMAALTSPSQAQSAGSCVDVNITLSRWPTRRLPLDDTAKLVRAMKAERITEAWAGTFDGLIHKDVREANAKLAEDVDANGKGFLRAFGSINPMLPDWEEDLRRCAEAHKMTGIRLHPNYHAYKLDDPAFVRLLGLATERGLIVQIALHMEDERMMHPLMRVEPVNAAPLSDALGRLKGARIVLLNALNVLVGEQLTRALSAGEVYVEIATLEGIAGIERLLGTVPLNRVLFGSHAPLFYLQSATLKLKESVLTESQVLAIQYENARALRRQA